VQRSAGTNVRQVTRVSNPFSRQRLQTKAVNRLPVLRLAQLCSTTAPQKTPSRSRQNLQPNLATLRAPALVLVTDYLPAG
jgi:hypothetical protein